MKLYKLLICQRFVFFQLVVQLCCPHVDVNKHTLGLSAGRCSTFSRLQRAAQTCVWTLCCR